MLCMFIMMYYEPSMLGFEHHRRPDFTRLATRFARQRKEKERKGMEREESLTVRQTVCETRE